MLQESPKNVNGIQGFSSVSHNRHRNAGFPTSEFFQVTLDDVEKMSFSKFAEDYKSSVELMVTLDFIHFQPNVSVAE